MINDLAPVGSRGGNTKTPPEPPTKNKNNSEKRISASKNWCFTWNNYPENWVGSLAPLLEGCDAYIFGYEICPTTGTKHIQGYIESKTKIRPAGYKGIPKSIHWEKAKGSRSENIEYCSKEGNVESASTLKPPRQIVFPETIGKLDWQNEILEIIKTDPDDRTIYWYWSHEGSMGKTTFTKYLCVKHNACLVSGKGNDVRNGVLTWFKAFDQYPELCIFPIPRTFDTTYLSYEALENIKDACFYSGKYEGGPVTGPCPHVFIFANVPPVCDEEFMKRIKVVNIDTEEFKKNNLHTDDESYNDVII